MGRLDGQVARLVLAVLAPVLSSVWGCSRTESAPAPKEEAPAATTSAAAPTTSPAAPAPLPLPPGVAYTTGPELIERIRGTRAKGVLVAVWASWCGPCRQEIPMFQKLQSELGAEQLEFLYVSVDAPDKAQAALDFAVEHGLPKPALLAAPPLGDFKEAMTPRWRGSLPASFLFDATGKLRYWWGAQVFEHEMTPILKGFLAGEPIDGEARFKIRKGGETQ